MVLAGCSEGLCSGDLLFQVNEGDFTDAIETSTGGTFSHVGIVEAGPDGTFVLEASPENGVVRTPLQDFLDASAHSPGGDPLVQAFRVPEALPGWNKAQARRAVRQARTHLGKPYDFAFAPGDSALYCSELVWESYRLEDGTPLFTARPMHFTDSTGVLLPYWKSWYEALGSPVPEGLPGTNPNDLSRSPVLTPVPGWHAKR